MQLAVMAVTVAAVHPPRQPATAAEANVRRSILKKFQEAVLVRTGPFDEHAVEYDRWFDDHRTVFLSELEAVKSVLPEYSKPIEIGVGTGRFVQPLGIALGIEPSKAMHKIAQRQGIEVVEAIAEDLPFGAGSFDLVLLVTTICFLDDVNQALKEAFRVLINGGHIVVGFIDRGTKLGREFETRKRDSKFYRLARFRSAVEILDLLAGSGFEDFESVQTIFDPMPEWGEIPSLVESGHGKGLFVVVRGRKG